jgi:DME family drug/metabolite transporter
VIALLSALAGSVLLVGRSTPSGADYNLFLGTTFALASAVTYACMILCGRFLASGYHPLQVTAVTFGAGTLLLMLISLGGGMVAVHTSEGWLLVVYLGLVPRAVAYWLFQKGLRSVSATAASIATMLDPLVAALLAWGLFGETLVFTGIFGVMLLILSIVLWSMGKKAEVRAV